VTEIALTVPAEVIDAIIAEVKRGVLDALERGDGHPDRWPGWMSVPTAGRYLDISTGRLYKLIARGVIPFSQEGPGCRVFLERRALDEWMRSQRGDA
jgi:excisionase family DNA binding protein